VVEELMTDEANCSKRVADRMTLSHQQSRSGDTPLISRDDEAQAVRQAISKLHSNERSRLLLLTGLRGAGKTAMIETAPTPVNQSLCHSDS
jgi:Cdc6-like AAA superfamily ATPase